MQRNFADNNRVARFLDPSSHTLPCVELLHVRYGGAVFQQFGTKASLEAWKSAGVWNRPITQSVIRRPPQIQRSDAERELTSQKRGRAEYMEPPSNDHITQDEAFDVIASYTDIQLAERELAEQSQKMEYVKAWQEDLSPPGQAYASPEASDFPEAPGVSVDSSV